VIIKGKSRGNGAQLGRYLVTRGENERIRVVEIRGVSAEDVPGAVLEMDALAAGARTRKGLYHAHINTPADERMTDEQRAFAVDRLEAALGLTGQPRVVVVHEKKGREHCHVVWSRVNLDRMAAIPDSHNYRKHEEVARELEHAFGLRRVQGVHSERHGKERPGGRSPDREDHQAIRSGLSPKQVKDEITGLWSNSATGGAFAEALEKAGYVLARGDRRDLVIVDPQGTTHSLARRIEGARTKDVRARMAEIDATRLPSVVEAKAIQRFRLKGGGKIPLAPSGDRSAASDLPLSEPDVARGRKFDVHRRIRAAAEDVFGPGKRNANKGPATKSPRPSRRRTGGKGGFGDALDGKPLTARHYNVLPSTRDGGGHRRWTKEEACLRGEFRAEAFWLARGTSTDAGEAGAGAAEGDAGGDDGLAEILDAIGAEVQGKAAGARAAVIAEYAGKIAYARKSLPRREAEGAVRALMEARAAALAHIAREASREIALRREAATRAYRKERRRPGILRNDPDSKPTPN
jgi:hypothetical protein